MQPLKITIPGDFWDVQIYMGKLYLWDMNDTVHTYNWDGIIQSFVANDADKLQFQCAFTNGSYLYGSNFSDFFRDIEIKELLFEKFSRIPSNQELSEEMLSRYCTSQQDNPFDELPTDTEIFLNNIFGVTDSGLYMVSGFNKKRKTAISKRATKLTDLSILTLKADIYSRFAISAGDEGLYEYDFNTKYRDDAIYSESRFLSLNKGHSQFADWNFASIYSSSTIGSSYLSLHEIKQSYNEQTNRNTYRRTFKANLLDSDIFSSPGKGLSWGSGDKIYRVVDNGIEVVKYHQSFGENAEEEFEEKQFLPFNAWKGQILSGGASFFGSIIECENALVVLMSDDEPFNISGPVVRWRTYPRSINYENHLHVIKENCVEIYSFNHDYFISQEEKKLGTSHSMRK